MTTQLPPRPGEHPPSEQRQEAGLPKDEPTPPPKRDDDKRPTPHI
ncbi:MAG TPA: hypothetical protein VFM93_10415 [Candidatus Limnocylindria bacterium]|nr:hypothetical protein [Candidatus Limnocylindria bacterium]